jgi:hypothetical protein
VAITFAVALVASANQTPTGSYSPPTNDLTVERTGPNRLAFTVPPIWGYQDRPVSFSDCAFCFEVNDTTIGPTDSILGPNGPCQGMQVRMFKGAGISGASVVSDGNTSFIVYIIDSDSDGHMSLNDTIVVQATEPLSSNATYSLTVITEVDSTRSYGMLEASYG